MNSIRFPLTTACLSLLLIAAGCSTPSTSNTPRTAVEQLLISNAVDQSLNKIDFRPFDGHAVHLSESYIESVDKPYIVGSVRHRLLAAGARIADTPEEADIIVEVRSGGVGTNTESMYVGTPKVALPGMIAIPEMKFAERISQRGLAKLGLVAYDARTHDVLGTGGLSLAQSTDNNWFVGGIGPFQGGTVQDEVKRSTTGPAGDVRNSLPAEIAFTGPRRARDEPQKIQFASGSEPAEE